MFFSKKRKIFSRSLVILMIISMVSMSFPGISLASGINESVQKNGTTEINTPANKSILPLSPLDHSVKNSDEIVNISSLAFQDAGNLPSSATGNLSIGKIEPANGASGVPLHPIIHVSFSDKIQPGDNINGITLKDSQTVVSTVYKLDNSNLIIEPVNNLNNNSSYTLYIPTGSVKDMAGNPLSTDQSIIFTTRDNTKDSPLVSNNTLVSSISLLQQTTGSRVAVLDDSYTDYSISGSGVGSLYPQDYPNETFTELNPTTISDTVLQNYDTLLLFMCNPTKLTSTQKTEHRKLGE